MLTATQASNLTQLQAANSQLQLPFAIQHSPVTCLSASLLGAALTLHLAQAHIYSRALEAAQTAGSAQAARHRRCAGHNGQARCIHTGKASILLPGCVSNAAEFV